MAITHSVTARHAAGDAVTVLVNGGALVFLTAADAVVASLALSATAFGAPSNGAYAANAITADNNTAAGTITKFELRSTAPAMVITGSVATSGADINLTSVNADAGGSLSVSSLNYYAMP